MYPWCFLVFFSSDRKNVSGLFNIHHSAANKVMNDTLLIYRDQYFFIHVVFITIFFTQHKNEDLESRRDILPLLHNATFIFQFVSIHVTSCFWQYIHTKNRKSKTEGWNLKNVWVKSTFQLPFAIFLFYFIQFFSILFASTTQIHANNNGELKHTHTLTMVM